MTIEKIEEVKIKTIYTANDGKVFDYKRDCLFHEWRLSATKVYVVHRRGSRNDDIEIYSTRELAEEAIKKSDVLYIREICINERVWQEEMEG